jgi:ABC-2 type transport system ATP-binding protein
MLEIHRTPDFMNSAVKLTKVSCQIHRKLILDKISLEVPPGSITGILGPNGAGKTTLLSVLIGFRRHSAGEVFVLEQQMPQCCANLRRRIGVVLQETALYEELSTFENLQFSASLYNLPDAKSRIAEVLELLMLTDRSSQTVRTLSGGLRRRVAIARALLHNPELLLIDEPTLGVDVEARHAIWSHLRLLKSRGTTTVVATNYLDEAQALCERVAILNQGQLLAVESPEELVGRTGNCLDVECQEAEGRTIIDTLKELDGVLRVEEIPGGLTVFLKDHTLSKQVMNRILQISQVTGFKVRAPDLAEVFKAVERGQ